MLAEEMNGWRSYGLLAVGAALLAALTVMRAGDRPSRPAAGTAERRPELPAVAAPAPIRAAAPTAAPTPAARFEPTERLGRLLTDHEGVAFRSAFVETLMRHLAAEAAQPPPADLVPALEALLENLRGELPLSQLLAGAVADPPGRAAVAWLLEAARARARERLAAAEPAKRPPLESRLARLEEIGREFERSLVKP
jgi:hypothetical protein